MAFPCLEAPHPHSGLLYHSLPGQTFWILLFCTKRNFHSHLGQIAEQYGVWGRRYCYLLFIHFWLKNFLSFMYLGVLPAGMPVCCVHTVPTEARRGQQIPWNWSFRWLWTAMWVLEFEGDSSGPPTSALLAEPSFQHLDFGSFWGRTVLFGQAIWFMILPPQLHEYWDYSHELLHLAFLVL